VALISTLVKPDYKKIRTRAVTLDKGLYHKIYHIIGVYNAFIAYYVQLDSTPL
jgi:hypothetical protein